MLIAVCADGPELESAVSARFETCHSLLLVNLECQDFKAIKNPGEPNGTTLAGLILAHDCEAVITGHLMPEAFDPLADAGVTRYDGYGYTARTALQRMEEYKLKLIRNPENTDGCGTDHHEGSCDGHHH